MLLKRYEFGFVFDHAKVVLAQGRAVKGEGLLSWNLSVSMRGIVFNFLRGANARSGHSPSLLVQFPQDNCNAACVGRILPC